MNHLKKLIIKHEGFKTKPYVDTVGKITIGVGRNLEDVGLSRREVMMLLENDIYRCEKEANTFPWFKSLPLAKQDAIISMLFNMGLTRFMGFKKMIAALEAGDYHQAASEMLDSKWAQQVGHRAVELAVLMRRDEVKTS